MNGALLLAIAGPVVAAAVLIALPARAPLGLRRWIAAVGLEAGIGGAIALLIRTVRTGEFASRGFEVDAWRALLALFVLVVGVAVIASNDEARAVASSLAAVSASVASVFAEDVAAFAALLVVTTLAFGVAAVIAADAAAVRAAVWFALADAAAIAGSVLVANGGLRIPLQAAGIGAGLLAVAAAVRCGVFPASGWYRDACARKASGSVMLGAMRAQGFAMAGWIGSQAGNAATGLLVGAAVVGAFAARRAARASDAIAAQVALGAIALAALARGVTATQHGAALLVAGLAIGAVLLLLERERDAGAPSIGAAPLGAAFPGAALIVVAIFGAGASARWLMFVAAALATAFAWLAIAGVSGGLARRASEDQVHPAWSAPFVAAALLMFALPGFVLSLIAEHAARALGAARSLAQVVPAVPNDASLLAVGVAGVAFLLVGVTVARRHVRAAEVRTDPAPLAADLGAAPWVFAITVSAATGWLIALLWVSIRRGFL